MAICAVPTSSFTQRAADFSLGHLTVVAMSCGSERMLTCESSFLDTPAHLDPWDGLRLTHLPNWNHEARDSAQSYVNSENFSKKGLFRQLTSRYGAQFTSSQANDALRHITVDYDHEALAAAREYEKDFHMSDAELFDQLTSEAGDQYTASQAHWAIDHL